MSNVRRLQCTQLMNARSLVRLAVILACGAPTASSALLACDARPCDSAQSCARLADWIVEGTFTLNSNTVWLENASLVRGEYPVPQRTTYLENASPTCYPALPMGDRQKTAAHLLGKMVRAYGSNQRQAFIDRGVIFLEVIPTTP